jgi:hypothetical protein
MEIRERIVKDMLLGLGKAGTGRGYVVSRDLWPGDSGGRAGRVKAVLPEADMLVAVLDKLCWCNNESWMPLTRCFQI